MAKDKFGNGQDTCKVCGQKLQDVKAVKIVLKHTTGTDLFSILYYAPLCDKHRGEGTLDVDIGWDPTVFGIDKMKDDTP